MLKFNVADFEKSLSESFSKYKRFGPRSPKKLTPLHKYVQNTLALIWGKKFKIYCLGAGGEFKVEGKYYPKDIDITVTYLEKPIFCVGVKFVTSNYKQNANNYFENMMGETANIQSLKNLPYAQLLILRYKTPYYKKRASYNDTSEIGKIEIISKSDLDKYIKLCFDSRQAHRPDIMAIQLIEADEKTHKVKCLSPFKLYDDKLAQLLDTALSVKKFFEDIESFKNYYELNQNGDTI
ncbi:MAG: hypothetical protein CVU78_05290 [Elusimicrobia bacterium HGW-Elusimicrobia-2]|nr:MAG: hypothetical protein CVU78_05290 [Elusimicrobia bacterium HGW-Elusimicrobia-2]